MVRKLLENKKAWYFTRVDLFLKTKIYTAEVWGRLNIYQGSFCKHDVKACSSTLWRPLEDTAAWGPTGCKALGRHKHKRQ